MMPWIKAVVVVLAVFAVGGIGPSIVFAFFYAFPTISLSVIAATLFTGLVMMFRYGVFDEL